MTEPNREDVARLLADLQTDFCPDRAVDRSGIDSAELAALCRAWLALHDATSVHVDGAIWTVDGTTTICTTPKLTSAIFRPLLGQTMKVVRWPVTPVEGGGDG